MRGTSKQRTTLVAALSACALFITLGCWAFSSPPYADADARFHIASIWCARGEAHDICSYTNGEADNNVLITPTGLDVQLINGMEPVRRASMDQQSLYYRIVGVFASKNIVTSVLAIRMFNSFIASLIFYFLITLTRNRTRLAVVTAWTFTVIPTLISTLPQLNPRSWAFLGVMSSWAFLHSGLSAGNNERTRQRLSYVFFGFTYFLAICTRLDATLFITFSSSVIVAGHLLKKVNSLWKNLFLVSIFSSIGYFVTSLFVTRVSYFIKIEFPPLYSKQQFLLFMFVHVPENIFNAVGLGYRQDDLGPGLIGIIGTSLLVLAMVSVMRNSSKAQISIFTLYSLMIFFAMLRVMDFGLQPPPGIYVAALLTALVGTITLFSAQDDFLMSTFTQKTTIISVLSFSHLLSLYAKFENSVLEGVYTGTYEKLSLNGGWWWNTPIGPNVVFVIGGSSFALWLILSWMTIEQSTSNPALGAHSHS